MHSWKIKLLDVKFHDHQIGSILVVGEDISESGACYMLQCGNAVPVDNDNIQINLGGASEENHNSVDDPATDYIGSCSS